MSTLENVRHETVTTRVGPVPVRVVGTHGPVVLASHGALVDGRFWDGVAVALAGEAVLLLPDLPLGAQRTAVPDRSRLTPPHLAGALVDVLDGLGHERVTIVGNDTGGALAQMAVAASPERFAGLVLTSCDAFEHFPPPLLRALPLLARVPGATRAVVRAFALPRLLAEPGRLNLLAARPIDRGLVGSWLRPALSDPAVLADFRALVLGLSNRYTLAAAEELRSWSGASVVAWSRRDRLFPASDGERLAATIPGARLQWIDDALTFSPLDRPDAVAAAVRTVLAEVAAVDN